MSNTPKAYHGYFGGKNTIGRNFITHYTPKNFKIYVEPFSGSYAVYFFTPISNDVKVIYNDYNKDQANLFYCSKNYDIFLEKLNYHLNNENGLLYCKGTSIEERKKFYKELYYSYKKSDFSQKEFQIGDYDRATVYAFLLTSAFNSVNYMAGGYSGFNKDKIKLLTLINKLNDEYVRDRFDKISEIHCMDFEDLIKKYDSPDTYFYLDPPYFTGNNSVDDGTRVGWYGASDMFDSASHKRLCDLLKTLKGKWSLSYYDFDLLHEWLPKDKYTWIQKDFYRSSASFAEGEQTKGTELLIMNYKLTDEEIEYNKKFLNSTKKPTTKTTMTKKTEIEKPSEQLLDELIVEIKKDLNSGDLQSLYELLSFLPINNIKNYLPEVIEIVDDILITEDEESGDNIVVENSDDFWE
ncbi:DNA adenine methylase [Candidatus Dojkabacteria bacterium]|jgi:DNA adenine methylase|nr:DNA adenine methylase [Candidatus Dojkabacteria bacterium]